MVESDTPATVDSAILVMEDTMARGLLTPRPTMVESDMPDMVGMAMVPDTDTLDKLHIRKYCGVEWEGDDIVDKDDGLEDAEHPVPDEAHLVFNCYSQVLHSFAPQPLTHWPVSMGG